MAFIQMTGHKGKEHKVSQPEGDKFINLDPRIRHTPQNAQTGYREVCDKLQHDPIANHGNYVDRH